MSAVIRLDRVWQRVGGEIGPDPGFDVPEEIDIPRVAESVGRNAKRAAVEDAELLFQGGLIGEELVLVHQLIPAGNKIPAGDRQDRFRQVGIQVAARRGVVRPSSDQARCLAHSSHRFRVFQ